MARDRRACAVGRTDSRRPGRHLHLDRGGAGVVHRQGPLDVDRVQPAPDRTPARGAIRRWHGAREPRDGPGVDGGSGGRARGARRLRRLPRGAARRSVWPRRAGARAHDVGRCVRRRDGRCARASQGARVGPRQVPGRRRGRARERGGDRSSGSASRRRNPSWRKRSGIGVSPSIRSHARTCCCPWPRSWPTTGISSVLGSLRERRA